MAIRGVASVVDFYSLSADISVDPPLYSYQNHFPEPRTISPGISSSYNSFSINPIVGQRDISSMPELAITFVGTAANVDLVEEAITNQYLLFAYIVRWNRNEGLDDPSSYNLFAAYVANATSGSQDISTVTLNLSHYSDTVSGDMPWRKIPWTIIGPLSARR